MSEPQQYRKRPVVIEAVQLTDDLSAHIAIVQWIRASGHEAYVSPLGTHITIGTPERQNIRDECG